MPRYTTVLFDADNTLFDFSKAERNALLLTLKSFDIPPSDALVADYSRINDEMWKRLERGELTKEALRVQRFLIFCQTHGLRADAARMAVTYTDFLSEQTCLIDGAEEVCAALARQLRLYIVTNGIYSVQTRRFAASALKDCFSGLFISEELGFEKPHPGFFEAVKRQIPHYRPEETLIVGDSLSSDIKGGLAAGIDTCWFNPAKKENTAHLPVTYEIKSLAELLALLLP
ncbi:MAG: YjjG family noncanonical pyrimidine nucleotidase [Clostridia bacterium]|nr:YjjG family noncanonical pyrimidine nucleotidase [Clostridia bacterium]